MREMKFRGFHKNENGSCVALIDDKPVRGEWVYGNPVEWRNEQKDVSIVCHPFGCCIDANGNLIMVETPFVCKVIPDTVGQYTGLKDCKRTEEYPEGQEIYEGDIVKCVALANDHHQRGARMLSAVIFFMGNACLEKTYVPIYPLIVDHEIEVIGNIYENPELLQIN
jgi:uncharacterized phage protein (TIGR01671 family)